MRFGLTLVITLFVGLLGYAGWLFFRAASVPMSTSDHEVIFEVKPGESLGRVALRLSDKNLIGDPKMFKWMAKLKGQGSKLRVGEYSLRANMTGSEILDVLSSGVSLKRVFTVPEGYNRYEIAAIFERSELGPSQSFLKASEDQILAKKLLGESLSSLEGYLYPETYHFTKFTSAEEVVSTMVKRFLQEYDSISQGANSQGTNSQGVNKYSLDKDRPLYIKTRHQVVTLASVIEKETGAPEERPLIASVFHNRLQKGMKLQSDPTIIYGILDLTKQITKNITRKDLQTPTRYNTYTVPALPYGPISNPGKDALAATLQPAKSDYLYFVSRNDGTHIFSKDYEAHNQAVRRFQLDPRARQGKSWRDLKKKPTNQ